MDWRGRTVLLTGASRGLGEALAVELGRAGARLALVAREEDALSGVVRRVREAGGEAQAVPGDVSSADAAARIAGVAMALLGPIEVVIHNASSLGPVPLRPLAETSDAAFEEALATNLTGPFRLSRALVGPMALRGGGLVVQVSSDAATTPYPGWGAYGASKAALEQLGRIWDAELASSGVRFVNLDPGEMDTRMHRDAVPDADPTTLARPEQVARRLVQTLAAALPARRVSAEAHR
jgi:NAD(P)-dependent dehydrogenase (short-subunit alcohol dehydrogenase family)